MKIETTYNKQTVNIKLRNRKTNLLYSELSKKQNKNLNKRNYNKNLKI